MAQQLTLEIVKNIYAENNCILLEETYTNNLKPMRFICSCGKEDVKNLVNFKKSFKCRDCANKLRIESRKISFDEVEETFKHSRKIPNVDFVLTKLEDLKELKVIRKSKIFLNLEAIN